MSLQTHLYIECSRENSFIEGLGEIPKLSAELFFNEHVCTSRLCVNHIKLVKRSKAILKKKGNFEQWELFLILVLKTLQLFQF